MKRLFIALLVIMATIKGYSQEKRNTINVNGLHTVPTKPVFHARMMVSLNNVYYDSQTMTLEEIKSGYFAKLTKAGISKTNLKENHLHYDLMGYEKDGTILEFTTTSEEAMQEFLNVRSLGVSKLEYTYKTEFTEEQAAEYTKKAFDNAKEKAKKIASKIGKKLGGVTYISDNNTLKRNTTWYYTIPTNSLEYHITVTFELL